MKFKYIAYLAAVPMIFSWIGAPARTLYADAGDTVAAVVASDSSSVLPPADSVTVNLDSLAAIADSLRYAYHFEESCNIFYDIISQARDSLDILDYTDRKIISQNGLAMSDFVATPVVVARKKFSLEDFYLYYPLPDKSWRPFPNPLDTLGLKKPVNAVFVPENSESIYFSAHDDTGARNIYYTEAGDSLWTIPALLNESMTSSSNDIYPLLSADGKTLYFASDGLFGAGGYDLYSAAWNEDTNEWGEPQNLGFPYSSPFNDYLYMNTPDGEYTIFASDRECSSDSVWVYVLEFDTLPVRKEMHDPAELVRICSLVPEHTEETSASGLSTEIPENLDIKRYMDKISQVNALRDTIFAHTVRLDQQKNEYAVSEDENVMENLTSLIEANEKEISLLQDSLNLARKDLQDIEMEFLFSGVVIDPQKLMEEAEKEAVPERKKYTFSRNEMGDSLSISLQKPEIKFDYTFRIQDTSIIAESNILPEGLVYQIQMTTRKTKADIRIFKGITPIFEIPAASGGYVYRAGLFNTYNDALSKLNVVKRKGFKYAKLVASENGKPISIQNARTLEKKLASIPDMFEIAFAGDEVTPVLLDEVMALAGKDVAKGERNGKIMYIVGPFDSKTDADAISGHLTNKGVSEVVCNKLEK